MLKILIFAIIILVIIIFFREVIMESINKLGKRKINNLRRLKNKER